MERLTIDEVIENCNKTCDMTEKIAKARGHELESIESNQFWEHYQVRAWLKELKQYKNLDEQGLLLRLPCKVGDIIYRVNTGAKEPVIEMRVLQVNFKQLHKDRIIVRIDAINDNDMGESCYLLEDFGKKVFLTKEEAEQKLKEMEID